MPVAVQVILAAAAVVTSLGVLWRKFVHPAFRMAKAADDLVPLLRDFTVAFKDTPQVFLILNEIAQQFRTDSGTTLRDVVNRLEQALNELQISGAAADRLTAEDRKSLAKMTVILELLDAKSDVGALDREFVAEKLRIAQEAVDAVAADLSEAHRRADETAGPHGAAADAAAQQTIAEKITDPPQETP